MTRARSQLGRDPSPATRSSTAVDSSRWSSASTRASRVRGPASHREMASCADQSAEGQVAFSSSACKGSSPCARRPSARASASAREKLSRFFAARIKGSRRAAMCCSAPLGRSRSKGGSARVPACPASFRSVSKAQPKRASSGRPAAWCIRRKASSCTPWRVAGEVSRASTSQSTSAERASASEGRNALGGTRASASTAAIRTGSWSFLSRARKASVWAMPRRERPVQSTNSAEATARSSAFDATAARCKGSRAASM